MQMMQRKESFLAFYVLAFVFVAIVGAGVYWFWNHKQEALAQEAKQRSTQLQAGVALPVAAAARGPTVRKLTLTGEARPNRATTLYSKVGGYLSRITVEVGDRVKAGQLIAEVQAPELESAYASAVAELENRQRIEQRTRDLAAKGFFSQQALDNAETEVRTVRGRVDALRAQMGYRALYAPYAGIVTARYVDPGALVTNAANNQTSSQPVVTISDASRLRVTVYVDQVDAHSAKPGTQVEISDAANPSRKTQAKISRVSGELDPRTRTLFTEVDFDNSAASFLPGSFVNVTLLLPQQSFVEVPAPALVVRDRKNYLAVLDEGSRIKLTPVEIAGTDGATLKIASGIAEGVKVALNVPNTVPDGAKITAVVPPAPPGAPAAAAPGGTPAAPGQPVPAQPAPVKPQSTAGR
jgi:membrane fusion protein, multidrug efflux system